MVHKRFSEQQPSGFLFRVLTSGPVALWKIKSPVSPTILPIGGERSEGFMPLQRALGEVKNK